jgi:RIO-like serine/threonine protein kinase
LFLFRELLTQHQWNLLKAIAKESRAYSVTTTRFIQEHKLGSSSAALRSLNALIKKEMGCTQFDEEGKKYYRLYDVLLMRWVQNM